MDTGRSLRQLSTRSGHSFAAMCLNFRACMGEFDNQGIDTGATGGFSSVTISSAKILPLANDVLLAFGHVARLAQDAVRGPP